MPHVHVGSLDPPARLDSRSGSDMHTLGYRFKPWREAKAIADGASILSEVQETAAECGGRSPSPCW